MELFFSITKALVIMVAAFWLLLRSKRTIARTFAAKDNIQATIVATRAATLFIYGIAALMIFSIFEVPIGAILAFGGIGSLAVGLAAKDAIANFLGGMMIMFNRPFDVGDWIKSPNRAFEGYVEEIGWYMTRIRTLDRRPTYIPNALITDAIVENPGRMYNRLFKTSVDLRYSDMAKAKPLIATIQKMLDDDPALEHTLPCFAALSGFDSSIIKIDVHAFTKSVDGIEFRKHQEDLLFKIYALVGDGNAEMAFPTQTLKIRD